MASSDVEHWQCDKSLSQCMSYMLANQIMCDVTFLLGEDRLEVHAHKYMLASRSPVFLAMLEGPMAEKGKIEIPDIEKDIFHIFLRYVYSEEVSLSIGNVLQVMYVSKKYCVDLLTKHCKDFLEKNITNESACVLMDSALLLQEEDIYKLCMDKIKENAEVCVKAAGFSSISRQTLKAITDLDDANIKEEILYEQVMKWCDAECGRQQLEATWENKRTLLDDILYDIRFPLMDPRYFAEAMIESKLLSDQEKVEIMYYHAVNKPACGNLFNCSKRCRRQVERVVRFASHCHGSWNLNGLEDAVGFQTSHDSILHGILVYGSASKPCTYSVVTRIKDSNGSLLSMTETSVDSNEDIEFHEIKFRDQVNIKADTAYRVEVLMTGSCSKSGKFGKTVIRFGNGIKKVIFFRSTPSPNKTNEISGQIPGLLLE